MKDIRNLSVDLSKVLGKLEKEIIEAHEKSVDKIHKDVVNNAPSGYGDYKSTIKRYPSEISSNKVVSEIGTALKTEDGYFLGRIIENGTGTYALEPHIGHTKTFIESGYRYWYVPVSKAKYKTNEMVLTPGGEFYLASPAPPRPHFRTTLEQDKKMYKDSIVNAVREVLKGKN